MRCRDISLKIERIPGYNPVAPDDAALTHQHDMPAGMSPAGVDPEPDPDATVLGLESQPRGRAAAARARDPDLPRATSRERGAREEENRCEDRDEAGAASGDEGCGGPSGHRR